MVEFETVVSEHRAEMESLSTQKAKFDQSLCERDVEIDRLTKELAEKTAMYQQKLSAHAADIETERSTYEQSREGLNNMYAALEKQVRFIKTFLCDGIIQTHYAMCDMKVFIYPMSCFPV